MHILVETQQTPWAGAQPVEIVERKGLGHPDTICDMLSERLSVALSEHYIDQFGFILHHNVDKALLSAGRSEPAFDAGHILEPIAIFLSGRATMTANGRTIPVRALAEECSAAWLRETCMRSHAQMSAFTASCSQVRRNLVELFMRQRDNGAFLANDTSCGVGYDVSSLRLWRRVSPKRSTPRCRASLTLNATLSVRLARPSGTPLLWRTFLMRTTQVA